MIKKTFCFIGIITILSLFVCLTPCAYSETYEYNENDDFEIKRNAVRCNECGDVIESKLPYDYVRCSCGACTIDGGTCYIRRSIKTGVGYTELTITE